MDSEDRIELLHTLDLKYRHATHECDLLIKDEEARRQKLRSMVLRDETSALKDQLVQRDGHIKRLLEQIDDVRSQLEDAQEKSRRQDKLMQSQAREINNLREELSAFNAVSQDSSKILSEKLALSREVAILKPELEHLQSQLAHQKDVLAEKLALERQLNTLEVDLANEKRAAQKAAQKQEHENTVEEDLRRQLGELEKELAKEKRRAEKSLKSLEGENSEARAELESLREQLAAVLNTRSVEASGTQVSAEELEELRQEIAEARKALAAEKKAQDKLRKENEQMQIDFEERQQAMGDKVDRLRTKFREAQEELKKCKAELARAQEQTSKISSVATTTVPVKGIGAKANAKKKRSADEMSMDTKVLLTPGATDDRPKRPLKKRGFDLSMVGGKSEFSITPFLNKTVNVDGSPNLAGENNTPTAVVQSRAAEDAPAPDNEPRASEPAAELPAMSSASKPAAAPKLVEKKPRGRPRTKPLSDSSPSKKNLTTTAGNNRKASRMMESTLEKVAEEPDEGEGEGYSASLEQENRSAGSAAQATTTTSSVAVSKSSDKPEKPEPKKKKRKLLGANTSTLFDVAEDEGERVHPAGVAVTAAAAAGVKRAPAVKAGGVKTMGKGTASGAASGRFGAGVKNSFGGASFSPLKRDRRGVAASFLA